jgi:CRP/FNR family transcriptional regulator, cyclic AMP receptor protein
MPPIPSFTYEKATVRSDQGKEAVVAIHGKGDFFGEGCLNGQPLRLASAVAMADSAIMRFTKAAIVRVLQEQPKFAEAFMSHLVARNVRVVIVTDLSTVDC